MYVCLCNGLTECQVRRAVEGGACRPREVYGACGCRAQCGSCTRMILSAIRDAAASLAGEAGREVAPAAS